MAFWGGLFKSFGSGFFKLFGSVFRIKFFWFFTLFIILNSIVIGVQAQDVQVSIDDLGNRFLTPTLKLNQTSGEIVENEGIVFISNKGFFSELLDLWDYLSSFWIIYLEIVVMAFLIKKFVLWDDSKGGVAVVMAIAAFFVLQMLYLGFNGDNMWLPIDAFKGIIVAIPYILAPLAKFGDVFSKVGENSTDLINQSYNSTI